MNASSQEMPSRTIAVRMPSGTSMLSLGASSGTGRTNRRPDDTAHETSSVRLPAVDDIPRNLTVTSSQCTISGTELSRSKYAINSADALANPEALELFRDLPELST